jgi:hypothetical protein
VVYADSIQLPDFDLKSWTMRMPLERQLMLTTMMMMIMMMANQLGCLCEKRDY